MVTAGTAGMATTAITAIVAIAEVIVITGITAIIATVRLRLRRLWLRFRWGLREVGEGGAACDSCEAVAPRGCEECATAEPVCNTCEVASVDGGYSSIYGYDGFGYGRRHHRGTTVITADMAVTDGVVTAAAVTAVGKRCA